MKNKLIRYTKRADRYLIKNYADHSYEELLEELEKMRIRPTRGALNQHCQKTLGLRKNEAWMKQERQRLARQCCEKRGEAFNERQRYRATHIGDSGCFGGRRGRRPVKDIDQLRRECKERFHSPEARKKANETYRKTIARDRRRVELGLEPLTRIANIGERKSRTVYDFRQQMKRHRGYIIFRNDTRHIYYDEATRRNPEREQRAEELDITVLPLKK